MKNFFRLITLTAMLVFTVALTAEASIVNPHRTYTYSDMEADIQALAAKYPDLISYKVIGKSEYGRNIYAVSLGKGKPNVFINGSHHAREWLTTNLNMYMLDQYAQAYALNQNMGSRYNVRQLLNRTKIWFVPMVNPDGVTLQQSGLNAFPQSAHAGLIKMNEGSTNFKRWKANAKGVDLNRQYDADWKNIKNNPGKPLWAHYKGTAPHTASEVKAIVNFTKEIDPDMAVAYHSAGKILYWDFRQTGVIYSRDLNYAKKIGQMTGYSLVYQGSNASGGGMTDWFSEKFKRPGFTPEIGKFPGQTNLPISEFNSTWAENKYVGLYAADESYKLYVARKGPISQEVNVVINGTKQSLQPPAVLKGGHTLVPLRGVFETIGANVNWDGAKKTVSIAKGDVKISLKIGEKHAVVNGEKVALSAPAAIMNSSTMVPLRFVSETIGAKVGWDSNTKTATIAE